MIFGINHHAFITCRLTLTRRVATQMVVFALLLGFAQGQSEAATGTTNSSDFTPEVVIDFSGLTPGTVLVPGDPIATGVTFGGLWGSDYDGAIVVDMGGGDRALDTYDIGTAHALGFNRLSSVVFSFSEDVEAVGATMTRLADTGFTTGGGNAAVGIHDINTDSIATFGIAPMTQGEQSFMGYYGLSADQARYVYFASSQSKNPYFRVDDLVIRYVPEPSLALLQTLALTTLAIWCVSIRREEE